MSFLSRFRSTDRPAQGVPSPGEPGGPSQPEGEGPITLEDRVKPGGQGSPDTNQGKDEPIAASDAEASAATPSLSSMNVGAADPQAPSHPGAPVAAAVPTNVAAAGGSTPSGTAHHATGLQGSAPAGEAIGSDVDAGARAMHAAADAGHPGPHGEAPAGAGDSAGVPATGGAPLPGSSEELPVVQGVRRADPDLD